MAGLPTSLAAEFEMRGTVVTRPSYGPLTALDEAFRAVLTVACLDLTDAELRDLWKGAALAWGGALAPLVRDCCESEVHFRARCLCAAEVARWQKGEGVTARDHAERRERLTDYALDKINSLKAARQAA